MAGNGQGNPAVVGLAGFGLTILLLQFHNLGWCGTGIIFCTALMLGDAPWIKPKLALAGATASRKRAA